MAKAHVTSISDVHAKLKILQFLMSEKRTTLFSKSSRLNTLKHYLVQFVHFKTHSQHKLNNFSPEKDFNIIPQVLLNKFCETCVIQFLYALCIQKRATVL